MLSRSGCILTDELADNDRLLQTLSCSLALFFVRGASAELAELLAREGIDAWIDLGVRPGKRLAHDWNDFFLSCDRVRDHLLFEWLCILIHSTVSCGILRGD